MKLIAGLIIVICSVLGGYVLSHGNLAALYQPFEFLIIVGGALGGFVIANPAKTIRVVLKNLPNLLKGPKYTKNRYLELLGLLFQSFSKMRKEGLIALEDDIENPAESALFSSYEQILKDPHILDFITDYFRMILLGNLNSMEIENLMDVELETHHHETMQPADAVTTVADGLPGFGIVAAVMGVVITMGAINEPPEILGAHIAAALVGTFLGILLAYGFVGPMGTALKHRADEESNYFVCTKVCIIAHLNGYQPQVAVEFGRKTIYAAERPTFKELDEHIRSIK